MTTADRPSVTDNARAEAQHTPACSAIWMAVGGCTCAEQKAAARAETTTATTEAAVQVIHQALQGRWVSVLRVLQEDDDYPAMLRHVVRRLADAGLLATARTDTTKEN